MSDFKTYVSTLVFSKDLQSVLLVKKKRPAWLAGTWTAVGGNQEDGETPSAAAIREVREEAALTLEKVDAFAYVRRPGSICTMFVAIDEGIWDAIALTDEEITVFNIDLIRGGKGVDVFSEDLLWLIEIALAFLRARNQKNVFLDVAVREGPATLASSPSPMKSSEPG